MGFPVIAMAAATAISAAGSIEQSRAQAASAGYNAKVAAQNAQIATENASYTGAQGEQNVGVQGAKNKATEAAITTNQGASGVNINSGSSVDVRESAAKVGMLDALNVRSQAARAAYGQQVQATSDIAQSQLDRSQQKADITGGYLNAGATVLGGVGKAAMYSDYLSKTDPTGGASYGPNQTQLPWQEPGWGP